MLKIAFVVPYYGKLPAFFRTWAYTAGYLKDQNIDFFLVTDLNIPFELPSNIKVVEMTFQELKQRIQTKFDFYISLETPYKLCDYKPAYGLIFSDLLQGYDFWGHCDVDVLWGNIRKFITEDILSTYDKIQYLGHFVLYRNCDEMNQLFKRRAGLFGYRRVFSTPEYYSFDEHPGMMQIVRKYNIKNYIATNQADISPRCKSLNISRVDNYSHQTLYWNDGAVIRAYRNESGIVCKDEFMYAHFQQKSPKDKINWAVNCQPQIIRYSWDALEAVDEEPITVEQRTNEDEHTDDFRKKRMQKFIHSSIRQKLVSVCISILTKRTNRYIQKSMGLKHEK